MTIRSKAYFYNKICKKHGGRVTRIQPSIAPQAQLNAVINFFNKKEVQIG